MSGGEIALAALVIGGSLVSAVGQLQAGMDAEKAGNRNAKLLFDAAHSERLTSAENRRRQKRLNVKLAGANRARGSEKLDLLEDTALEAALAEADITFAGNIRAVGYENRGFGEIARGQAARKASKFGAFSTVLMGVAQAGAGPAFGKLFGTTPLFGGTTPTGVGSALQFNPSNINPVPGSGGSILRL